MRNWIQIHCSSAMFHKFHNGKAISGEISPADCYGTPDYAVMPLVKYLNPAWQIWEPCCGNGRIVRYLAREGFAVVGTDLQFGVDMFNAHPVGIDCIITNPPYSINDRVIQHLYLLRIPFALLVPPMVISNSSTQRWAKQYGMELLLLDQRVSFYSEEHQRDTMPYPVLWLCSGILPQTICYGTVRKP